ncbi:MAG: T9SS type A sorting domain-containing protein [Bacteroidetes bacterium]|nr:T9SS type A sorting domain-containing protein [Bacteroidota bacterium]
MSLVAVILAADSCLSSVAVAQSTSWTKLAGPYEGDISRLVVDGDGNVLAASQFNGVYRSTDGGSTWLPANAGLSWENLTALTADSSGIIYGGGIFSGLYKTSDQGGSWEKTELAGGAAVARVLSGGRLCIGGLDTVSISTDEGNTWASSRVGDTTVQVISLAEDKDGNIYAGLQLVTPYKSPPYGGGVYVSRDKGKSWEYDGLALVQISGIEADMSGEMFLTNGYTVFSAPPLDTNWVQNAIGLPHSRVNALSGSLSGDVVAAIGDGLYVYDEKTQSWDVVLSNGASATTITSFHYDQGGTSYVGTARNGIFRMSKSQEGWIQCGIFPTATTAVACYNSGELYVGTGDGIFKPGAQPGTWRRASNGLLGGRVYGIDTVGNNVGIYAATSGGLFYTIDGGDSWAIRSARWTYDLAEGYNGTLYAGTTSGILESTQGGSSWAAPTSVGLPISTICSVLWSNGGLLAGTSNNGVFATTDGGDFWFQIGISSPIMFCTVNVLAQASTRLETNGYSYTLPGAIYAGTDSAGAFYTTDSGQNWTHIPSIAARDVSCFLLPSAVQAEGYPVVTRPLFAGAVDRGVFVSTDGGANWQTMNEGLADSSVASLAMDPAGFLYAATDSGVYKTSEVVTAVHSSYKSSPGRFFLNQNYPNPFNPATDISYQLSAVSHVELRVYDLLGRHVETLVNRVQNPGSHTATFNGGRLSSGVYFYRIEIVPRLETGKKVQPYTETRKMVLVK